MCSWWKSNMRNGSFKDGWGKFIFFRKAKVEDQENPKFEPPKWDWGTKTLYIMRIIHSPVILYQWNKDKLLIIVFLSWFSAFDSKRHYCYLLMSQYLPITRTALIIIIITLFKLTKNINLKYKKQETENFPLTSFSFSQSFP